MSYVKTYESFLNEDKKLTFFHGTLSSNVDSIREHGLLTTANTNKKIHGFNTQGQISLTGDYNLAFYYASIFSDKKPITILVIQLDTSYKFNKGISFSEYTAKFNIRPENILGAYNESGKLIPLNKLNKEMNYIDMSRLTGNDLKVAQTQHTNK